MLLVILRKHKKAGRNQILQLFLFDKIPKFNYDFIKI
jgi:hypothetical protein